MYMHAIAGMDLQWCLQAPRMCIYSCKSKRKLLRPSPHLKKSEQDDLSSQDHLRTSLSPQSQELCNCWFVCLSGNTFLGDASEQCSADQTSYLQAPGHDLHQMQTETWKGKLNPSGSHQMKLQYHGEVFQFEAGHPKILPEVWLLQQDLSVHHLHRSGSRSRTDWRDFSLQEPGIYDHVQKQNQVYRFGNHGIKTQLASHTHIIYTATVSWTLEGRGASSLEGDSW